MKPPKERHRPPSRRVAEGAIAKFYFSVGNVAILDDAEGTELPDLAAARSHAGAVALELMRQREGMLGHPWPDWTMTVKNEKGEEVFSLRLADAADGYGR